MRFAVLTRNHAFVGLPRIELMAAGKVTYPSESFPYAYLRRAISAWIDALVSHLVSELVAFAAVFVDGVFFVFAAIRTLSIRVDKVNEWWLRCGWAQLRLRRWSCFVVRTVLMLTESPVSCGFCLGCLILCGLVLHNTS